VAAQLVASQEGLNSKELVSYGSSKFGSWRLEEEIGAEIEGGKAIKRRHHDKK
jgi:hypothetical protein